MSTATDTMRMVAGKRPTDDSHRWIFGGPRLDGEPFMVCGKCGEISDMPPPLFAECPVNGDWRSAEVTAAARAALAKARGQA